MALSDVYGRAPWAPSQDLLQRQTEGARALPGLHQQGQAIAEQQAQADRLNRPVTPWQKAIMRLMAGEDPQKVAMDTQGELANAGPQGAPAPMQQPMGQPQQAPQGGIPPSMSQAIFGPPQQGASVGRGGIGMSAGGGGMGGQQSAGPISTTDSSGLPEINFDRLGQQALINSGNAGGALQGPVSMNGEPMRQPLHAAASFAAARNPPMGGQGVGGASEGQPGGLGGVSMGQPGQWRGRGGITEDTFSGMNGRDYNDYVAGMHNANAAKQQRDWLAEQQLRNKGSLDVATANNTTKEKIATERANLADRNMSAIDKRKELERRLKGKEIDERTVHHIAEIELGYEKLRDLQSRFERAYSQKDRLALAELLVKHADAQEANFSRVESSLSGLAGMGQQDIRSDLKEKRQALLESKKAAQEEIDKARSQAPAVNTGQSSGQRTTVPRAGTITKKRKADGYPLTITPQQFDAAVKAGRINPAEWE